MWKHMSSPYILKFNGLFYRNEVPAIVTPWMPHGNITEYLKSHDVDRLRLVSLNDPPGPALVPLTSHRVVAFGCGQRGQVPPRPQHSAWGHQSGKPYNSYEKPDYVSIMFPAKHPYCGLHPAPSRACRLRFHPRNNHFGEGVDRRTRHNLFYGPRAPPPEQIRPEKRGPIQRSGHLRIGYDGVPSVDGYVAFLSKEGGRGYACGDFGSTPYQAGECGEYWDDGYCVGPHK